MADLDAMQRRLEQLKFNQGYNAQTTQGADPKEVSELEKRVKYEQIRQGKTS